MKRIKKLDQEDVADAKDFISFLPLDMILLILAKLPPKSIAKFIAVSKLWSSIVHRNDLTEQFISRSSTRPRFLFVLRKSLGILEFDQYKVLWMMEQCVPRQVGQFVSEEHQVFTLGGKKKAWRMIECKHPHVPATNELCKDGVIYYGAWYNSHAEGSLLVSFDVRSEEFGVIKLPKDVIIIYRRTELVNYHGNIALVDCLDFGNVDLWVLKDVKKQEWSRISVLLPRMHGNKLFYCRGTISIGEIVFAPSQFSNPFFLIYLDPKGNNVKRVDIEGVRDSKVNDPIRVFMDHVESPMVLEKEV